MAWHKDLSQRMGNVGKSMMMTVKTCHTPGCSGIQLNGGGGG